MGQKGTSAANAFAALMQGIAQGIHGMRQQQSDNERESRIQDYQNRDLSLRERQMTLMNEDRDLARQERIRHNQEAERDAHRAKQEESAYAKILGDRVGSQDERKLARKVAAHMGPQLAKGMDEKSIIDMFFKPGTADVPMDATLKARLTKLNAERVKAGGAPIDVKGQSAKLSTPDLLELAGQDNTFREYDMHNKHVIEPALKDVQSVGRKFGVDRMDAEQWIRNIKKNPEVLQELGLLEPQGQGAEMPQAPQQMGVPEGRESQTRAGNLIRHRTDSMVSALLGGELGGMEGQNPGAQNPVTPGQLGGLFSTDPRHRVAAWMELHTAGYPVMPPTLDFAVDASSGTPVLKQDIFAMMEQVQPGMGQAANEMLQGLAGGQQKMQQQGQGPMQGPGFGRGSGEQAAKRAQSRPAQTQQSMGSPALPMPAGPPTLRPPSSGMRHPMDPRPDRSRQ